MVKALYFQINFLKVEEVRGESVVRSFCLKKKKNDKNYQVSRQTAPKLESACIYWYIEACMCQVHFRAVAGWLC